MEVVFDYCQSDGLEIALRIEGEGRPLLLIHGFASNMEVNWVNTGWTRLLARTGYQVICFDNRGHGRSEKPYDSEAYSAPLMARDALAVLDHLGVEKASVMGYSMGARITAFMLEEAARRERAAIFAGMGYNMVRGMAGSGPIALALEADSINDVSHETARSFRAFAERAGGDLKALAACMRGPRLKVSEEMLERIACPVLIAVGEKDVIAGDPHRLAALIKGAQVAVIPRRDHMQAVGDRALRAAVAEFLANLES
jgi:pimeloyl-ACP methyl ester carboxylesterase